MRIDGTGRSAKVGQQSGARRKSGTGEAFTIDSGGETSKAASASSAGPVTEIDAILALQSVDDPLFAKKKLVKRGLTILDTLEELKADLLAGHINEHGLNRLVSTIRQARGKSDPQLDAIIDDIELRARVELAKLGKYPAF